jgi:hypothetical protein
LINWRFAADGGCHIQVQPGADVLWAFTDYTQKFLQLTAPTRAAIGEPFDVTVEQNDASSGTRMPASAASVAGASTDANGQATVSFADPGGHTFKATLPDAIRSNAATVCVYVPGSGDCGTDKAPADTPTAPPTVVKDTTPPVVEVSSLRAGKIYTSGPRELSGQVTDAGGIAQVFLRLRATDGGDLTSASRCRWFSGKRGVFTHRTVPCSKARFFRIGSNARWSYLLPSRLGRGRYALDVKVLDRAYNAARTTVAFKVK